MYFIIFIILRLILKVSDNLEYFRTLNLVNMVNSILFTLIIINFIVIMVMPTLLKELFYVLI